MAEVWDRSVSGEIQDGDLPDAVAFFADQAGTVVTIEHDDPAPVVSYAAREVPLRRALAHLALLADMELRIDDDGALMRPRDGGPAGESREDADLEEGLSQRVTMRFVDNELIDVAHFLQRVSDVPMMVHRSAYEAAGIHLEGEDLELGEVVETVAEQAGVEVRYAAGAVLFFVPGE